MNQDFPKILSDIDTYLVGRPLQPINPATAPIFIMKVDLANNKYFISTSLNSKGNPRSTNELKDIWFDLVRNGFANVEQSMYGSGSSRNQPETLFANLPYIQHFKFKNKKHLLLRDHNVHQPATLSEVQGSEFRRIRKLIESHQRLNLSNVIHEQSNFLGSINEALSLVFKKFPGEATVQDINSLLKDLERLNMDLIDSVVTLDSLPARSSYLTQNENYARDATNTSLEDFIGSSEQTGIDEGDSNLEGDANALLETLNVEEKSSSVTMSLPRIRQLTPVLSLIFDRINYGDIDLRPDFQRKDRIWKHDKKAKLIESILMRLPLPVFYFAEKTDGTWVVVDGLQRITTVYDFISGEFSLEKLNVLPQHDGKFFQDLTRTEQRDIREYAITAYLIDMDADSSKMIVELFHRINTYGIKLSDQEIRSALNQGSSVRFLRYLASLEEFKRATKYKVNPERQKDMELCLSALAFMVNGYQEFDNQGYDAYLSKAMLELNKYKLQIISHNDQDHTDIEIIDASREYLEIATRFTKALSLSQQIFGESAFVKEQRSKNAPISKQLFELIIYFFSLLDEEQTQTLLLKRDVFFDTLYKAIEKNSANYAKWDSLVYEEAGRGFFDAISTSTGKKATVKYRFEAFSSILKASTDINIL